MSRPMGTEHPIDQLLNRIGAKYGCLTREEAVKKAGISAKVASYIRQDKQGPTPRVILTIYDHTGIPVDEIRRILGAYPCEAMK